MTGPASPPSLPTFSSSSASSYPSPGPSSPYSDPISPSPSPATYADEPRRSKRDSTASSTRRHEEAAAASNRYPSPPIGSTTPTTRSRPGSVVINESSLQIPPYNPNRRRAAPADERINTGSLAPVSRIPATHQTTHRPASAIPIHLTGNGGAVPPSPYQPSPTPTGHAPSSASASSRVRQSVGYLPNSAGPPVGNTGAGPYPHLYTPHQMPRQRIYFGPYILLQTLGEGEFGKVKLGIHSERWGEEVAIKLIKRGNVDTAQRGEKVRREIEVLKMVRHPNIVRLYDVIETEKYIGIVLEYASGGELFDHILAHRYLKERDASRLFAQLISGVAYLHAKGIVHRDLKLENLLLDRNRNVVVTDFGFANRFEDAEDDLMATSCGSPCYAAPELVVQEGKYVGTAVDVWSCGVILYAMLAGYLPYDDDPANPEGDNINLLYKYIINTPLSFPEWITAAPRNLLLMMLVPNPELRCTLEQVTKHPFLRNYAGAFDKSVEELEKMAQDAEMAKRHALEAQRLFLAQKAQQELAASSAGNTGAGSSSNGGLTALQAQALARSQSSHQQSSTSVAAKHRSAIVTSSTVQHSMNEHHLHHQPQPQQQFPSSEYPQSQPMTTRSSTSTSTNSRPSRRDSLVTSTSPPTTQSHSISVDADPFSYATPTPTPPTTRSTMMVPSFSASPSLPSGSLDQIHRSEQQHEEFVVPSTPSSGTRSAKRSAGSTNSNSKDREEREREEGIKDADRRKRSNRATVQVEYDGVAAAARERRKEEQSRTAEREGQGEEAAARSTGGEVAGGLGQVVEAKEEEYRNMSVEEVKVTKEEVPQTVVIPQPTVDGSLESKPMDVTPLESGTSSSTLLPLVPQTPTSPSGPQQRKRKSSGTPTSGNTIFIDPTPPPPVPSPTSAPKSTDDPATTVPGEIPRPPSSASARTGTSNAPTPPSSTRHRATASSDRFSIRALLSGSNSSLDKTGPPVTSATTTTPVEQKSNTPLSPPVVDQALDEVTNSRKSRRQKALSLQPFRAGTSSKLVKIRATEAESAAVRDREREGARTRSTTIAGSPPPPDLTKTTQGSMQPPPRPSAIGTRIIPTRASTTKGASSVEATWNSSQAGGTPSGKAKAVMDWFRRKSTRGFQVDNNGTNPDGTPALPIRTDFDHTRRRPSSIFAEPPSSPTTVESGPPPPILPTPTLPSAPSVVITHATAHPDEVATASPKSGATSQMTMSTFNDQSPSSSTPATPSSLAIPVFTDAKLRVHQGALDKSAITSRSPPVVMQEIKAALYNMGIDVMMEPGSEFKLKCVRRSRKKVLSGASAPALTATGSVHSTHSNQSGPSPTPAASSTLDRRTGLPASSSATPSGTASSSLTASPASGFRSFFNRRNSVNPRSPALSTSEAMAPPTPSMPMSPSSDAFDTPLTKVVSNFGGQVQPLPSYGESDAGDEVKFYVEITKVRALDGLYCIDVKRMKGGPWSFKFVYDQLISALDLKSA